MVDFSEIIKRIIDREKLSNEKDVAELFGFSAQNFSKRKKSGSLLPLIISWGISKKVDLNWLLTGNEPKYIEEKDNPEGSTYIYKEGIPLDEDPVVAELLEGARKVLKSGNRVAFDALERNIRYFSLAIETEQRLQTIEARMARIEQTQAQADHIRSADDPEKKQEIIQMRQAPSA